ncbi:MAG: response regulator [bacterium]|nr:response regulator [bacterium]
MRILVVDDNRRHLEAAREQLGQEHEITCLDAYEDAIERLRTEPPEVLLADLLMPAEPYMLGPDGLRYLGHEMPIGLILALIAARAGVGRIAVITDANHHNHPMSAAVDWINPAYWSAESTRTLRVEDARVLIAHAPLLPDGRKDWTTALAALE